MKKACKLISNGIALTAVLPAVVGFWLSALILGPAKTFPGWSQALSLLPGLVGVYLRRSFYRLVLAQVGTDAFLGFGTIFSHRTARIGKCVYVGPYCCLGDITLEDDVLLGSHVSVANGGSQHGIERLDLPIREQPGHWPRVTIGRDTWIGDRTVVLANVGQHCVIGAGSVVTKPLPDYAIAVGVPAKVVRYRSGQPARDQQDAALVSVTPAELGL
jgi:virginiamycin A acetyltransferase